jgi:hypothetical protein
MRKNKLILEFSMVLLCVFFLSCKKEMQNKQIEKYLITKCEANFFSKIRSTGTMKVIIQIIKEKNGIIESRGEIFFNKKKISNGIFKFINPKIFKLNVK